MLLLSTTACAHGVRYGNHYSHGGYYNRAYNGYGILAGGLIVGSVLATTYYQPQPVVIQQPVYVQPIQYQEQMYQQQQICEARVENINGQMIQGMFCHN